MNHLSPYAGSAGWPNWELPFLRWAEREGYAIDLATNADLGEHPELLTDLGYGDIVGAAGSVVGYECDGCDFTYRDGLPYPTGEDGTPTNFEIVATAPAAHFTRTTASRPPPPGVPGEDEYIASRLFNSRDQSGIDRITHGHAVLGSYESSGGGTVVTTGSTDWACGLGERDPVVEQITRNIFTRLG